MPAGGANHPPGAHFQRDPSHIQEPSIQKRAPFGCEDTISTRAGGGGAGTSTKSASGGGTAGGRGSEPHPTIPEFATVQSAKPAWRLKLTRLPIAPRVPRNEGCKPNRLSGKPAPNE